MNDDISPVAFPGATVGINQSRVNEPQDSIAAALPDLEIDPLQSSEGGDDDKVDWNYKDLDGAKIQQQDDSDKTYKMDNESYKMQNDTERSANEKQVESDRSLALDKLD